MKLREMSWPEVGAAAERAVAVLPLAATEEHGPHLAVSTDEALVTIIAERVEHKPSLDIVLCPTVPFGSSHHHLGFPGTISLRADYTQAVTKLVKSLIAAGFYRIVLLNGHRGNIVPVKQALAILNHTLDEGIQPNIALFTDWELAGKSFAGELPMESPALSHACEYETRMMLYLFPDRVHLERARRAKCPPSNPYVAWEDEKPYRGVSLIKKTQYISSNGSSGEPQLATAAKGEVLLSKAIAAVAEFIAQFKDWPLMRDLRNT